MLQIRKIRGFPPAVYPPRILLSSKLRKFGKSHKNGPLYYGNLPVFSFFKMQKAPAGGCGIAAPAGAKRGLLVLLWDSVQMLTRGLRSHCRGPHSSWPRHPSCNRTPCSGARDSSSFPCRCRHPVHGSRPHTAHGHCSLQT